MDAWRHLCERGLPAKYSEKLMNVETPGSVECLEGLTEGTEEEK